MNNPARATAVAMLFCIIAIGLGSCAAPLPQSRLPEIRASIEKELSGDRKRYFEFAYAHNEILKRLPRLECEADFEIDWTEDGQRHIGTGDATVWLQWPTRGMLLVRKLSEHYLWFGHDDERAWLFLRSEERNPCWIALIENANSECCKGFPFGLPPHELRSMLGLGTLPTDPDTFSFTRRGQEWLVIEPLGRMQRRSYLNERNGDLLRTELILDGSLFASVTLTGHANLDIPECAALRVPMRFECYAPNQQARLSIRVWACAERAEEFPSQAFRPSAISFQMNTDEWIVLDEDCPKSARTPASIRTIPSSQ